MDAILVNGRVFNLTAHLVHVGRNSIDLDLRHKTYEKGRIAAAVVRKFVALEPAKFHEIENEIPVLNYHAA